MGRGNGGGSDDESAKPVKGAPRSSPYHRNSLCMPRGPRQICCTASASGLLRQVPSVGAPGRPHTKACGSTATGEDHSGVPDEKADDEPVTNEAFQRLMSLAAEQRRSGETVE